MEGASIKKRRLFFARINLMKYLVLNFIHLDKEENYFSRHTSSVVVHLAVVIIRRMGRRKEEKIRKNNVSCACSHEDWMLKQEPNYDHIRCFPSLHHCEVSKWTSRVFLTQKKTLHYVIGSEKKGKFLMKSIHVKIWVPPVRKNVDKVFTLL